MKKVKKGDQSRLSSFQRSKDSGRRRCRFSTDLNVLNFIHMYIYIYHSIYLVFSIFSSPLSRMMKKENGGSSHSVWNNEKFSKSKSKRGKKRVERTIDNRHEARTSGNNGKFDERIDACIVCRSIAIVCRKRYLSLSLSRGRDRSPRPFLRRIYNKRANTISLISLAGRLFTLVKHVSILLCNRFNSAHFIFILFSLFLCTFYECQAASFSFLFLFF